MRSPWQLFYAYLRWRRGYGHFVLREDGLLVRGSGDGPADRVAVADIVTWLDYGDPWIYVVPLHLRDGRVLNWRDRYGELEAILERLIPERRTYAY